MYSSTEPLFLYIIGLSDLRNVAPSIRVLSQHHGDQLTRPCPSNTPSQNKTPERSQRIRSAYTANTLFEEHLHNHMTGFSKFHITNMLNFIFYKN